MLVTAVLVIHVCTYREKEGSKTEKSKEKEGQIQVHTTQLHRIKMDKPNKQKAVGRNGLTEQELTQMQDWDDDSTGMYFLFVFCYCCVFFCLFVFRTKRRNTNL